MVKTAQYHLNCKVGHNFNFTKTGVPSIWVAAALIVRHLGSIVSFCLAVTGILSSAVLLQQISKKS